MNIFNEKKGQKLWKILTKSKNKLLKFLSLLKTNAVVAIVDLL